LADQPAQPTFAGITQLYLCVDPPHSSRSAR